MRFRVYKFNTDLLRDDKIIVKTGVKFVIN